MCLPRLPLLVKTLLPCVAEAAPAVGAAAVGTIEWTVETAVLLAAAAAVVLEGAMSLQEEVGPTLRLLARQVQVALAAPGAGSATTFGVGAADGATRVLQATVASCSL